jgi:integrase/recombinase XerD
VIRDKVLTEEEINQMLSAVKLRNATGFTNRLIIEILYGTGLRISELVHLEIGDIYKEEKYILVRNGKGKKDRMVPLGDNLNEIIWEYIGSYRVKLLRYKKSKYLLIRGKGKALTIGYAARMIKNIVKLAELDKRVSSHVIRHTYATHLIKAGADIRHVQLLLGHSSIRSTEIYINLNKKYLKEEYEKYHPLENELYYDVYSREKEVVNKELTMGVARVKKKLKY